jgi:hypothetical protein
MAKGQVACRDDPLVDFHLGRGEADAFQAVHFSLLWVDATLPAVEVDVTQVGNHDHSS